MISTRARIRGWLGGLIAVGVATCASAAVSTLPFTDGFETNVVDDPPSDAYWTTNGEGSVKVSATAPSTPEGNNTCMVYGDTLTLHSSYASRSNVWLKFFALPAAYDDETNRPSVDAASAAIYLSTSGVLYAYADTNGGDGWTSVTSDLSTAATQWHGFNVHLDYVNTNYDIYYLSGSTVTGNMSLLTPTPLKMSSTHSNRLNQFSIQSGATTYVDAVAFVGGGIPVVTGQSSSPNVVAPATITIASESDAAALVDYFGILGSKLEAEAGDMLGQALGDTGQISIWDPATGFNRYTYHTAAGFWEHTTGTRPDADGLLLSNLVGLWVKSGATGVRPVTGVGALGPVGSMALTPGKWNFVQWPHSAVNFVSGVLQGGSLGLSTLTNGAYICVPGPGSSGDYDRIVYKDAKWYLGGSLYNGTVSKGQGFWYLPAPDALGGNYAPTKN